MKGITLSEEIVKNTVDSLTVIKKQNEEKMDTISKIVNNKKCNTNVIGV